MIREPIRIFERGQRVYHAFFGWAKIYKPLIVNGKVLLDLEAKEISYYVMGKGYVTYKRDKDGKNILRAPVSEVFDSPDLVLTDNTYYLKLAALNPTVTYE